MSPVSLSCRTFRLQLTPPPAPASKRQPACANDEGSGGRLCTCSLLSAVARPGRTQAASASAQVGVTQEPARRSSPNGFFNGDRHPEKTVTRATKRVSGCGVVTKARSRRASGHAGAVAGGESPALRRSVLRLPRRPRPCPVSHPAQGPWRGKRACAWEAGLPARAHALSPGSRGREYEPRRWDPRGGEKALHYTGQLGYWVSLVGRHVKIQN